MCKYLIRINMKYGNMNVNAGDDYNNALGIYRNVKKEYENIPCTIELYNKEKEDIQFVRKNNGVTFDELLNNFKDALIELARYQVKLCKEEKQYTELRNQLYHDLENTDLSELDDYEQIKVLHNMKKELSKRRLIEEENIKNYGFYNCFKTCYKALQSYEDGKGNIKRSTGRFGDAYYKESINDKKGRVKNLLNDFR